MAELETARCAYRSAAAFHGWLVEAGALPEGTESLDRTCERELDRELYQRYGQQFLIETVMGLVAWKCPAALWLRQIMDGQTPIGPLPSNEPGIGGMHTPGR